MGLRGIRKGKGRQLESMGQTVREEVYADTITIMKMFSCLQMIRNKE